MTSYDSKHGKNKIQNKHKISRSHMWQILREEMAGKFSIDQILEMPLRILDDKYLILQTLGEGRYAR
jgi:hypothetical protein